MSFQIWRLDNSQVACRPQVASCRNTTDHLASCSGTALEIPAQCSGTADDGSDCAAQFAAAAQPAMESDCPAGCDYTAASRPTCDMNPMTDGTDECPNGCGCVVADEVCEAQRPPPVRPASCPAGKVCSCAATPACTFRWAAESVTCSTECGLSAAVVSRAVRCLRNADSTEVPIETCNQLATLDPQEPMPNPNQICPATPPCRKSRHETACGPPCRDSTEPVAGAARIRMGDHRLEFLSHEPTVRL